MLILAGASLNVLVGQNGILRKAQEAVVAYKDASDNEQEEFKELEYYLASQNPDEFFNSQQNIKEKVQFARNYLNASVSVTKSGELLVWVPGTDYVSGYSNNSDTPVQYRVKRLDEGDLKSTSGGSASLSGLKTLERQLLRRIRSSFCPGG